MVTAGGDDRAGRFKRKHSGKIAGAGNVGGLHLPGIRFATEHDTSWQRIGGTSQGADFIDDVAGGIGETGKQLNHSRQLRKRHSIEKLAGEY